MKKSGFTLTELLLALGVIGVIAAITSPIITNLVPDKDKARVLKVNKIVSEITEDLLSDPGLYYRPPVDASRTTCSGLACTDMPRLPQYANDTYTGDNKYGMLLADRLNLMGDTTSVIAGDEQSGGVEQDQSSVSFTTTDGIRWEIVTTTALVKATRIASTDITLDFDTNSDKNCSYSSSCLHPDRFILNVDTRGKVTGGDPLTRAYLANPYKLNDRKNDLKTAKADKT